ncbi:unnamed protein product [Heligmosomoides polygyrus]|uniref:Uncharacterized protein n=1 Tax=Heligmosomoides polygyrus TaxID=6339 RepID=A0A183FMI5_HELPZ|nr:unnamed protein product [Heligmosomoides polygyrus]
MNNDGSFDDATPTPTSIYAMVIVDKVLRSPSPNTNAVSFVRAPTSKATTTPTPPSSIRQPSPPTSISLFM